MDDITQKLSQAYLQVLGFGKEKQEAVADEKVIVEEELDESKMDPVNKKALKKDFKDREDKDIDNDGDEDESDEYLHNRRKAIAKAVKEEVELDEANFAATMKKAIAAHERGDHKMAKYHLDNAKTARYAMKSTEISKNKEMLDKYEKLRDMHEEVDQLDELSKSTLGSYIRKASGNAASATRAAGVEAGARGPNRFANMDSKEKRAEKRLTGVSKAVDRLTKEEIEESSYQKDIDEKKPVYAQGVKGAKSKPFKKKFKNMAAYEKWADTDEAGDYEVHQVFQEAVDLSYYTVEELDDFMMSEEFKQLDEISQGLLRRYHGAAASDLQKRRQKLNKGTMTTQDHRSGQNRVKGLNRAANKMEEVEQVDELSQNTLRKYHGAAASDLQKRRQKLAHGTMTTQDHKAGQRRVAGLNRAANKMEATDNEIKYGRHAGMLIDRVQEAKDPKAGATPPQTYGDNASQNTKDFVDMHKAEVSHDAEKANMQNFKDFTAKVKVAKKRPNDNSAGDTKVVK
jgi:hypothetical protein